MEDNLSKLFKKAYNYPENQLSMAIWHTLEIKQAQKIKKQSAVYVLTSFLSLGGFVFVLFYTKEQFTSSGFFEYISLLFSDGSVLASFWKEYLLSLADSIPVASVGVLSFLLFSMLFSIRKSIVCYRNQLLRI